MHVIGFRKQDRDASGTQRRDCLHQPACKRRRDALEWLVQQQSPAAHESTRERHELLLSARELERPARRELLYLRKDTIDEIKSLSRVLVMIRPCGDEHVLLHR